MFDRVPEKTAWTISGTLEFEISKIGRFSILDVPDITVDFSSDSLDLRIPGTDEFEQIVERKQWRIENNCLIADFHELDLKNGHLRLQVIHDRRFLPIYGSESKRGGFQRLSKTNLVFTAENRLVIGGRILDQYDIVLNGINQKMTFTPKTSG
jgi:hypothetical protein